jgi:hypothetical protein
LSHDIGAATPLTAGCYIFGLIPSSYQTGDAASRYLDVPTQFLDTAISSLKNGLDEGRKAHIMEAIKSFKVFGAGAASTSAECIEWTKRVCLPVVLDFGMTEVGESEVQLF